MRITATVMVGIFFIALASNAFAGDLAGDLRTSLGGIQKATYDTVVVKPVQAASTAAQILIPHINNVVNTGLEIGKNVAGPNWDKTREFVKNIPFFPGGAVGQPGYPREHPLMTLYKEAERSIVINPVLSSPLRVNESAMVLPNIKALNP